jgi:glucose-1-phosphate thymidylyltransferase
MKGIILAEGTGSRLYPVTAVVSKQLLPVFDKPMVYYPLSTLMFTGIRDILIITTPQDQPLFHRLLGDGSEIGVDFSYAHQDSPRGVADAFIVGRDFVGKDPVTLVLGDSIFYGSRLPEMLSQAAARGHEPRSSGTPSTRRSNMAWSSSTPAAAPCPSRRSRNSRVRTSRRPGSISTTTTFSTSPPESRHPRAANSEITDVNRVYLERGELFVRLMGRGMAWLDIRTRSSLVEASHFVQILEQRQGLRIACPEEIALRRGYISLEAFEKLAQKNARSSYGQYLLSVYRSFGREAGGA